MSVCVCLYVFMIECLYACAFMCVCACVCVCVHDRVFM